MWPRPLRFLLANAESKMYTTVVFYLRHRRLWSSTTVRMCLEWVHRWQRMVRTSFLKSACSSSSHLKRLMRFSSCRLCVTIKTTQWHYCKVMRADVTWATFLKGFYRRLFHQPSKPNGSLSVVRLSSTVTQLLEVSFVSHRSGLSWASSRILPTTLTVLFSVHSVIGGLLPETVVWCCPNCQGPGDYCLGQLWVSNGVITNKSPSFQ